MQLQRWLVRLLPYGRELEKRAFHDPLTGVLTRGRTVEILEGWIYRSGVTLVYIDIDGLKEINDTCGHWAGDGHLEVFAKRLQGGAKIHVRGESVIGRMGGDEFLLGFLDASRNEIIAFLGYLSMDKPESISFSFGIVESKPSPRISFDELLKKADEKMYHQKKERKKTRIRKNKR